MYTITEHIKADQMKLYGHILRSPHTDLMKNVSFTAAGAIRGTSGKSKRGRKRTGWLERAAHEAWTRVRTAPNIPLRRPRQPPPPTQPFQPFFTSSPFDSPAPTPSGIVPLTVVAQFKDFWREFVVQAPTRTAQGAPPGGTLEPLV